MVALRERLAKVNLRLFKRFGLLNDFRQIQNTPNYEEGKTEREVVRTLKAYVVPDWVVRVRVGDEWVTKKVILAEPTAFSPEGLDKGRWEIFVDETWRALTCEGIYEGAWTFTVGTG